MRFIIVDLFVRPSRQLCFISCAHITYLGYHFLKWLFVGLYLFMLLLHFLLSRIMCELLEGIIYSCDDNCCVNRKFHWFLCYCFFWSSILYSCLVRLYEFSLLCLLRKTKKKLILLYNIIEEEICLVIYLFNKVIVH